MWPLTLSASVKLTFWVFLQLAQVWRVYPPSWQVAGTTLPSSQLCSLAGAYNSLFDSGYGSKSFSSPQTLHFAATPAAWPHVASTCVSSQSWPNALPTSVTLETVSQTEHFILTFWASVHVASETTSTLLCFPTTLW